MEPCGAIVVGIYGGGARGLETAEVFDAMD
jgi:hypothetical protein